MRDEIRFLLYYLPGLKAGAEVKGEIIRRIGGAVLGCELHVKNVGSGPGGGGPGVMVGAVPEQVLTAAGTVSPRLAFCPDPARQVWMEGDGFWVGYDVEHRPMAEDLRRRKLVGGYVHKCADTGQWTVPLARTVDGGTALDERVVFLPGGGKERRVMDRYRGLCAFAEEHYERLTGLQDGAGDIEVTVDDVYPEVAAEALAVNYHVGPYELSLLGVLTVEVCVLICGYLCDWPGLCAEFEARSKDSEKKTSSPPGASSTSSGEAAG